MRIGFRVDQLGIDAQAVGRSPNAPFEQIADTQFAADLSRIDGFVAVGERGSPRDDEQILKPRQLRCQILGDAVGEILLLGVLAEVRKRQDNDRQARRDKERRS